MPDVGYVDPEVRPILEMLASQYGDYSKLTVEETRALFAQNAVVMAGALPDGCEDGRFEIPGPGGPIPCRWYRPKHAGEKLPVMLYFMGGTYVATSLDQAGRVPPVLAIRTDSLVVVPLHRIPPENPFPAAYDDCLAVYRWMIQHAGTIGGDPARIAVSGESSGGTLAAAVCIDAREEGLPQPALQVLAEPLVDHLSETSSVNELSFVLDKKALRFGSSLYFGDAHPPTRASPIRAASLKDLAPAYIITAGLDPLRDEGIAYAARLRAEGCLVAHRHHEGQLHGFFSMFEHVAQSKIAFAECCAAIKLAFSGPLRGG